MRKKLLISCSSLRSILNITPKSNHLSIEACDSVGSSKLQCRGWSHAAACVPSENSDTRRKRGQRVPKHERRAMVESFVNKYRSENAGKLPTIKYTQKEVGGSYYVIRDIIQELEYKSKMKPLNNIGEIPVAKLFDESKLKSAEPVSVSSGDTKTFKDGLFQNHVRKDNHHVTSDSNILEIFFKDFSSPQMPNDKKVEEQCIRKASYERREQPALGDIYGEASHSSPQVPNDVKSDEAVSSCPSDYVAPERHQLKEEIEQVSALIIEKSGSSSNKDQIHDSVSVDLKNHPTIEIKNLEKAGLERKVQDGAQDNLGMDSPKHKKEQSHGSLKLDESKIDSSNKRESSSTFTSDKSNLWGNLKSFADGILNIWRKF